jgi:hypothetical protein
LPALTADYPAVTLLAADACRLSTANGTARRDLIFHYGTWEGSNTYRQPCGELRCACRLGGMGQGNYALLQMVFLLLGEARTAEGS